jgi:mannan endo-1,4-beta-mannosidase
MLPKEDFRQSSKYHFHSVVMVISFCLLLVLIGITQLSAQQTIDQRATKQTKALCANLTRIAQHGFMVGHQEDLAYGVGWNNVPGRSDVKDVCGSYPAVLGWDIGKEDTPRNIDLVAFENVRKWIIETYKRGGINTVSWHVDNTTSGGNAWDTTRTVSHILPGGKDHEKFKARLDKVADFILSCKINGVFIPMIFRPYHEHNGSWFWWGKGNCTEQEYVALWRFTVDYLRNTRSIHHLLYAFSPDRSRLDMSNLKESYLYGYPGDDYVDVLGFDNYMDVGIAWNKKTEAEQTADLVASLTMLSGLANEKNKSAALTETGLEGVTNPAWFTRVILNPLKSKPSIKLAYLCLWRNANIKHHYGPYPGHASETDFKTFYADDLTLFENDIQNMYRTGKPLTK